jgi:hypothetical protein
MRDWIDTDDLGVGAISLNFDDPRFVDDDWTASPTGTDNSEVGFVVESVTVAIKLADFDTGLEAWLIGAVFAWSLRLISLSPIDIDGLLCVGFEWVSTSKFGL